MLETIALQEKRHHFHSPTANARWTRNRPSNFAQKRKNSDSPCSQFSSTLARPHSGRRRSSPTG